MRVQRRRLVQVVVLLAAGVFAGCSGTDVADPDGGDVDLRDGGEPTVVVLQITGMTCTGCTVRIRAALVALDGVVDAVVTLSPAEARVEYWPDLVTTEQMIDAVRRLGYEAAVL